MTKKNTDPSNLLGIISTLIMLFIVALNGGNVASLLSISSFLIVCVGTMGSTLNSHSFSQIIHTFSTAFMLFTRGIEFPYSETLDQLVSSADVIRKEGPLALEKQKFIDPLIKKGIGYIVDGTKTDSIFEILEIESASLRERHKDGQEILENMGSFAPAWGMIGTIIGLVFMLLSLDNPDQIGSAMATALLTTLYGALLANALFLPTSIKFENLSREEMLYRAFVIEGIISVASSENPHLLKEKLLAYLNPTERAVKIKEFERRRRARFARRKS